MMKSNHGGRSNFLVGGRKLQRSRIPQGALQDAPKLSHHARL